MKPNSPDRCNLIALRQATRQVTHFYETYFKAVGLRATQFGILDRLDGEKPISINELAAAMVMDAATMGRALKPLEREGYIAIGPGRDGRTRALKLTKSGAAKLKSAWAAWHKATEDFEAKIGGADTSAALRQSLRLVVGATMAR
jgi:DNA-binding MarR family transcriptional regulator